MKKQEIHFHADLTSKKINHSIEQMQLHPTLIEQQKHK